MGFGTGLYTTTEVAARLTYRMNLFNTLTNCLVTFPSTTINLTSSQKAQDLSSLSPEPIDILEVFFTPDAGTTWYSIPRGSATEVDEYISSNSTVSVPSVWNIDTAAPLQLLLSPAPAFTGSDGQIVLAYISKITAVAVPPLYHGTSLAIPDDFTPFIKYGVLADLFNKSGEVYDPARAALCESIFQLGVQVTAAWLTGTSNVQ